MIAGGIISFIPFLFQVMLGRPPPDNENVFSYVASATVDSGSLGILYAMMTVFGLTLVMYGIFNLNGLLQ